MRKNAITTINICYVPCGTTLSIRDAIGRNNKRIDKLLSSGLALDSKTHTFTAKSESEWNKALEVLKVSDSVSEN